MMSRSELSSQQQCEGHMKRYSCIQYKKQQRKDTLIYCGFKIQLMILVLHCLYPILFTSISLYLCALSKHLVPFNKGYSKAMLACNNNENPQKKHASLIFSSQTALFLEQKGIQMKAYMHNVSFLGYGVG